jgi:ATP-dependent DNA ligase
MTETPPSPLGTTDGGAVATWRSVIEALPRSAPASRAGAAPCRSPIRLSDAAALFIDHVVCVCVPPVSSNPAFYPPPTARRADRNWIHEIKHDGFRLMARRDPAGVRLFTRNGNDWTPRYPLIFEAVNRPQVRSCLIDGEAVCSTTTASRPSRSSGCVGTTGTCSCPHSTCWS